MPPVTTDPNKVRSGRVDMNARRLGTGEDAATRKAWRLPNHRPMRFDSAGRGMFPKATGLPGSVKKRKSTDGDSAGPPAKKARTAQRDASKPDPLDVSGASLDHDLDEEGEVRVFDTCDAIRRKIRTFLTKHESEGPRRKIQHAQLTTFMDQRGTMTGNTTGVYYAAYVFFEKLRIKERKNKSADREVVESYHVDGLDRSLAPENVYYLVSNDARGITMDKYGRPNVYYGSDWKGNPDGYDKDNIPDPDEQFRMLERKFIAIENGDDFQLPPGFPYPSKD
ncbi:hypothetical protein V8F06_002813 [Rhypophila decipiens]